MFHSVQHFLILILLYIFISLLGYIWGTKHFYVHSYLRQVHHIHYLFTLHCFNQLFFHLLHSSRRERLFLIILEQTFILNKCIPFTSRICNILKRPLKRVMKQRLEKYCKFRIKRVFLFLNLNIKILLFKKLWRNYHNIGRRLAELSHLRTYGSYTSVNLYIKISIYLIKNFH